MLVVQATLDIDGALKGEKILNLSSVTLVCWVHPSFFSLISGNRKAGKLLQSSNTPANVYTALNCHPVH